MNKTEMSSGILGIVFFFALILYSITSSTLTMFLHLFLLISGLVVSILMTNKITKSSNTLKTKLYFSFIISFMLFFSIAFFWMLGNHSSIDDKGLTTAIIIIPTTIICGIISFIVGLSLSLKRKKRKDFDYNLKYFLLIATIISIILFVIFFYNPAMRKMAIAFEDENLCHATITNSGSYMFAPHFYSNCMMWVGIKTGNTRICDDACDSDDVGCIMNTRSICYTRIGYENNDIEYCAEATSQAHCVMSIAEKTKNIQLCELLDGGSNPREEFSGDFDRDFCINKMAPVLGDKDICNSINKEETRNYCLEMYDFYREKQIVD
jgi:hypothetical protein